MHQGSKKDGQSSQAERDMSVIDYSTTSDSTVILAGICLFKVNSRNTRTWCEIYSKLIIKTSERRQLPRSCVFIVNFDHISHLVLMFLLLTLNMQLLAGGPSLMTNSG